MSQIYRTTIPRGILIVVAVMIWITFFTDQLSGITSDFKNWATTVSLLMVFLGNMLFFTRGISHVKDKKPFWYFRGFSVVVAVIFMVVGLGIGRSSSEYSWLMQFTLSPASSAAWLTAFFIFVMSYHRYIHFRDVSTFILLIGLMISTVYRVPMFAANPIISDIGTFVFDYPSTGVIRALTISTAVGMIVTVARTFMGLQRSLQVKEEVV